MIKPIHLETFRFDGRGPDLLKTYWILRGATLAGLDYANSADPSDDVASRHVHFLAPQVAMITPEEVISKDQLGAEFFEERGAAMFDCGRSEWLLSFSGRHLGRCSHFKLLFYDELVDVICEGVELGEGRFPG